MIFELKLRQEGTKYIISNSCWEVIHDSTAGGCITSIRFPHDLNRNILAAPISSIMQDFHCAQWTAQEYRECRDPQGKITVSADRTDHIQLDTESELKGRSGESTGIFVKCTYHYYPGHCRVEKRFHFSENTPAINRFSVVSVESIPELDRWMVRPSPITNVKQATANSWIKQQGYPGAVRFGTFDSYQVPFYDFNMPMQLSLYRRDGEAIEVMLDSDYANWLHAADPSPDAVRYSCVRSNYDPDTHQINIEPFCGAENGKYLPKKDYQYNFYLNLPNNTASGPSRAMQCSWPILRFRKGRRWATEEEVRKMAEDGVQFVLHHHDSPSGHGLWEPGSFFWPTGVKNPYNEEETSHLRECIGWVHKYGMKIIPYFNPFELHPRCEPFMRNRYDWGRYFDGHYVENKTDGGLYGIACCMKSGYFDYLKEYIRYVVTEYGFDGCYFDGLNGNFCEHPSHFHGVEHITNDEMFELVRYARELAGPDGLVVLHNSTEPSLGLENYCDSGIGMEDVCGFPNFELSIPTNGHFGEHFRYGRHIARMICGWSALGSGRPDQQLQLQKLIVRALLEGVTFYGTPFFQQQGVDRESYFRFWREFKSMKKENLQFFTANMPKPLNVSNPRIRGALALNEEEALLLLGNADGEEAQKTSYVLTLPDGTQKSGETEIGGYDYQLFRFSLRK